MLRWFLYTYPSILGLIKAFVYKCAYGRKLHFAGLPHIARTATIRMRKGTNVKIGRWHHSISSWSWRIFNR